MSLPSSTGSYTAQRSAFPTVRSQLRGRPQGRGREGMRAMRVGPPAACIGAPAAALSLSRTHRRLQNSCIDRLPKGWSKWGLISMPSRPGRGQEAQRRWRRRRRSCKGRGGAHIKQQGSTACSTCQPGEQGTGAVHHKAEDGVEAQRCMRERQEGGRGGVGRRRASRACGRWSTSGAQGQDSQSHDMSLPLTVQKVCQQRRRSQF